MCACGAFLCGTQLREGDKGINLYAVGKQRFVNKVQSVSRSADLELTLQFLGVEKSVQLCLILSVSVSNPTQLETLQTLRTQHSVFQLKLLHFIYTIPKMSRPSTAGSASSSRFPGQRSPGVKGMLQNIQKTVNEHDGILQELTKTKEQGEDSTQVIFDQMQQRFDKIMDEMRTEMTDKLKTAYVEIERLRKQLSIVKGEQTIHQSQLKDQSRGVQILEKSVADLQRELNGDVDGYD